MPTCAAPAAGLTAVEAARRLAEFGPNAVAEEAVSSARRILAHLWGPVPWMLEATIALQLAIGESLEAAIIAALLILNAALGVFQEHRADTALALLRQRLALIVRVHRDRSWCDIPAVNLVPGDVVQLTLGAVVPADCRILRGSVLLDQSTLTGESIPAEAGVGATAYAGALVRRGEAVAEVTATGQHTYFGRAAELVRVAHVESSEQKAVLGIVRTLTIVNVAIVVAMVGYAHSLAMTVPQIIPLVLTALLAAVPVALPATFTLAATLGAKTLAAQGVLLTRLTALHEAAMIDVLCADKTGTLTENELGVAAVRPVGKDRDERQVLAAAMLASSADGRDPVDVAVRAAAAQQGAETELHLLRFVPFDPTAKMAEAVACDDAGNEIRLIKGAPAAVAIRAPLPPAAQAELARLTGAGYRTLAVAAGPPDDLAVIGLIGLSDPPRPESRRLLAEIRALGIRPVMVTGDAAATAATIARAVGLEDHVCPPGQIPARVVANDFAAYAGVFPEDKFRLVKAFQQGGHIVGMCGDGTNDAPALRQAQMGIAISTATDVAKAAAAVVLTTPGLGGIVASINEGRAAFQRILTYTLSLLVNKCATIIVLGTGLLMTGHAVLTPILQATSMLAGDFVTMSRAADRARPSPYPNAWHIRNLILAAIPLAVFKLGYYIAVLAFGWFIVRLDARHMQTLTFLTMVLGGQATIYVLRERGRLWHSRPAWPMLLASTGAIVFLTWLALAGILMRPLNPVIVASLFGATIFYALAFDTIKLKVLSRLRID